MLTAPATGFVGDTSSKRATEIKDKEQAVLVIGLPGVTMFDPDRFALDLIQESCSDLGSRLFIRIREKLGLAYFVGAQQFAGLSPGYFAFYVGTAPEKVDLVEKELLAECETLRASGLSNEELARAKAKVIGHNKIARQELGSVATHHCLDELYGLGYEHHDHEDALYEAVTAEQIIAAARKHLDAKRCVIATIKPA